MANYYKNGVEFVDTTGAINSRDISGIKIVATAGATAILTLKETDTNGSVIYTTSTATGTEKFEQVQICCKAGLYATVTGAGANAYIYTDQD